MGEGSKRVGAISLAISSCVIVGALLQSSSPVELHSSVATRPAVTVMNPPTLNPQNRAYTLITNDVQPGENMLVEERLETPTGSSSASWMSFAFLPLAAVAGYLIGRRAPKTVIDPMDIYAPYNSYSMLSVSGAAEAEGEAAAEPASPKAPVALEKSYAKIIQNIEKQYLKDDVPNIQIGDTVTVGVRIKEGEKERVQDYTGVVICMRNGGLHKAITVRAVLQGVGVERIFPVHAPQVAYINIMKRAKVRRAKLFYLRDRAGKAARLKQRFEKSTKSKA